MAHGSRLMPHASTPVAQGQENLALGPGAWGTQRQIFLGLEPRALSHEPRAMSHEPFAIIISIN